MAVLRTDRVFVAVNDAFTEALGYPREQVVGRLADPIISPDERAVMRLSWETMLDEGRIDYVREVVHANGHHMRIHGASERASVTGRSLVMTVARAIEPAERYLTRREAELVGHVAAGKRAHQIAADLHLATSTVQTHLRNAMVKLGARSQAHLVALAMKRGELDAQLD
jgi:PAS domain S-box-containing protein